MTAWCWESGPWHAGALVLGGVFLSWVFGTGWNFLINEQEYGLNDGPETKASSHRGPGRSTARSAGRRRPGWRNVVDIVMLALSVFVVIQGIASGLADWKGLVAVVGALSFVGIVSSLLHRFGLRRSTAHATLTVVRGLFAASILTVFLGLAAAIHAGQAC